MIRWNVDPALAIYDKHGNLLDPPPSFTPKVSQDGTFTEVDDNGEILYGQRVQTELEWEYEKIEYYKKKSGVK